MPLILSSLLRKTAAAMTLLATVTVGLSAAQGTATAAAPQVEAAVPQVAAAPMASAAGLTGPRLTQIVTQALHQTTLGISYLYAGGHGPTPAPLNSHVDCSGFVRELYYWAFGADIGGGSADSIIRLSGKFTKTSNPVPGDVVLLGNNRQAPAYHAGIFVGDIDGHPAMVGSPTTGQNIKIQPGLDAHWVPMLMGYWHYNGATAADSGSRTPAPVAVPKANGRFDRLSGKQGGFSMGGWAFDPQNSAASNTVAVLVDGRTVAVVGTPLLRGDVNQALHVTGSHGFSYGIRASVGRHNVCLTARPAGTSSTASSLGCRAVVTPGATRGSFDKATGTSKAITISGWAFDTQSPTAGNRVRVTIDGRTLPDIATSQLRADVNRIFGVTGNHGFSAKLVAGAGRHTVCTVSLPTSTSSVQSALGCRTVTVPA